MLAGCGREEIRVYNAPKDEPPPPAAEPTPRATEARARPRPQLAWKLPEGWREGAPSQINVAAFSIPGADGKQAEVSIAELANLSGKEAMLVNMWRDQTGLPALSDTEALKQLHPVTVGGETGSLFEVSGKRKEETFRIVTAILHHPEGSWFFKLAGNADLVGKQQPAFLEFLKSIHIKEAPPAEPEATVAAFHWTVPAGWTTAPPNEMQVARFSVSAGAKGKAEVFVSVFPSDTGGNLANVNRWRRQIGLGPVKEDELGQIVSPLDPLNPQAILVDMRNNDKRLVGAIVPREGRYWFYKLLGDDTAAAAEKQSFITFAKSNP